MKAIKNWIKKREEKKSKELDDEINFYLNPFKNSNNNTESIIINKS